MQRYIRHTDLQEKLVLRIYHKIHWPKLEELHEAVQNRLAIHRAARDLAECGQVAIVYSGRDCDGVQYSGKVELVTANWGAIINHINTYAYWADGPFTYTFMKPSEAQKIHYRSRDLTLEAFENGHPHLLIQRR